MVGNPILRLLLPLPRTLVYARSFTFTCRCKKKIHAHTRTYNLEVLASKKSLRTFFFQSGCSYTSYLLILCDFLLDNFMGEIGKYIHKTIVQGQNAWRCKEQRRVYG